MYKNKKNTWTLFLGHLVIEKLLKGLYAKKNEVQAMMTTKKILSRNAQMNILQNK